MKMDKISIIVAVYNTEKYVEKCIESLLNQTYKNIELIIVEDGSTDSSKMLVKKYEKSPNIKVIYNEKNNGLSYSRNVGIENSTGKYIGFIDSDDFINADYFEKLYKSIINEKSDIAVCDFKLVYEDHEIISPCYEGEFSIESVIANGLAASCCNKLFKKDIINKYRFEIGKVNEDIAVVIPCLAKAKKISYVPDCYYNYYQRNNSIQNSKFSEKRFDIIEAVELTSNRIKNNENYEKIIESLIFYQIIQLYYFVIPKEKNFLRRYSIIKTFFKLSKAYKFTSNSFNIKYIENSGRLHSKYYKFLSLCKDKKMPFSTNLIFFLYDISKKILKQKTVIKKNINIANLIKLAKKQSLLKNDIKISVVIPNYNYERFLYERLYSILIQTVKIDEIIILDDCSCDNSRELIMELVNNLKNYIDIKYIFNKTNSGIAFKQWKKGFENSNGDYVWIAEADDYCNKNLLKNLITPIKKDKEVVISYSDTAFINSDGGIFLKSIKPEIDILKSGHWNKNYINDGKDEIINYSYLNNTIANVSSCIIKNGNYSKLLKESCEYKQSGDWVFYINLYKFGKVAYTDKILNYYRVHGNNVSSTMNRKKHIEEILKIYNKVQKEFPLNDHNLEEQNKRIDFLKDVWKVK